MRVIFKIRVRFRVRIRVKDRLELVVRIRVWFCVSIQWRVNGRTCFLRPIH